MNELKEFTVERLSEIAADAYEADMSNEEMQALAKIALATKRVEPVGEVRLSDYDSDGCRQGSVTCLHDQADWDNFPDGTKLYTAPPLNHAEQDGWIKCSEQLPPNDDFVLVWPTPDFGVDMHAGQYMKYHKKGAGWFAQVNEQNYGIEWHPIAVTHWMPLPATPKPEM